MEIVVYQAPPIQDSGHEPGKFYFAPERNWDISRSAFSPGYDTPDQAQLAAAQFSERQEVATR